MDREYDVEVVANAPVWMRLRVQANSLEEAKKKAEALAAEEHSYAGCEGAPEDWEFNGEVGDIEATKAKLADDGDPTLVTQQRSDVGDSYGERDTTVLEYAGKIGFEAADLDEAVHDATSAEASEINNTGLIGQLTFLLGKDFTANQAKECLDDHNVSGDRA